MDIFRTLIVQSNQVELAREVGASYGAGGEGMFITPLSSTGSYPATHYVSTGFIPEQFIYLLSDANALHYVANEAGVVCTIEAVTQLLANADISDDEPFVAMARLGVSIISAPGL